MTCSYREKENARKEAFGAIWDNDINDVFSDVADYYDRINAFASLGMLDLWRQNFISTIETKPNDNSPTKKAPSIPGQ